MKKLTIGLLLLLIIATITPSVFSGNTDTIVVTLNPQATASISVNQPSWSPGAGLGGTEQTSTSWATLTNDGLIQVDVTVEANNTAAWTLESPIGHNKFLLSYLIAGSVSQKDTQANYAGISYVGATTWAGQILEPSSTYTCSKVDVWIKRDNSASGYMNVSIRSVSGNPPIPNGTSTILALNNTVTFNSMPTSFGWVTFNFNTPVALTSGTKYCLCMGSPDYLEWRWKDSNPYGIAKSQRTSGNGLTWTEVNNDCDFAFKIYGYTVTTTAITTSPASFTSNLSPVGGSNTYQFGLKIQMPTSSSTNTNQETEITFTATAD
jgi:hypothetical protein